MDQQYNIANVIMDLDESIEDRIAIRTPDNTLTYGQLRHLTTCFALHLRERGVGRSSCVAISTTDIRVAMASTLATALLGASWVQANRWSLANEALGITHLIHGGSEELPTALNVIEIDESWTKYPDGIDPVQPIEFDGYASPDDTYVIAQTSGTTGNVKHVALSFRLCATHMKKIRNNDVGGNPWISVNLFHPLGTAGFRLNVRIIHYIGTIIVGGEYDFWHHYNANSVTGSPAAIGDVLSNINKQYRYKINILRSSGSSISIELVTRALKYFSKIRLGYGSTETGILCDRTLKQPENLNGKLGIVHENNCIQIVDDESRILSADKVGSVRARSETQATEYIGDPAATARAFRHGWFYPGDIGYLTQDGQLVVTARTADILNLGGMKVNAIEIDEVIQAHPSVLDGICFAEPNDLGVNELALIVWFAEKMDINLACDAIAQACRNRLGPPYVPRRVYVSDTIPRSAKQKASRHKAVEFVKVMQPAWVLPSQ